MRRNRAVLGLNKSGIINGGATDVTPPTIPTGLITSAITSSSFTLIWTASTDNVGVTLYDVFLQDVYYGSSTGTSMTITGLAANTSYTAKVKAKDAAGNESALSAGLVVTTLTSPDTIPPSTPSIVQASNITISSFDLTWTASTDNVGVTNYKVYRNGTLYTTINALTTTISGLASGTQYQMQVSALDASGNESPLSSVFSVTTPNTTGSFSVTGMFTSPTSILLTFDFGDGASNSLTASKAHSYYTWQKGNYGFSFSVPGLSNINITNISVSGNNLLLDLSTYVENTESLGVTFAPVQKSPKRFNGQAIPSFTTTINMGGTLSNVRYVSTTGTGNGLTPSTPWSISALNAATLPSGTVVFVEQGTYSGTLVPKSNVKYFNRNGLVIIGGNSVSKVCEAVNLENIYFRGIQTRNFNTYSASIGFGYQGWEIRACRNMYFYNCEARYCTNGFFFRGKGAQFKVTNYQVVGCYARECYNSCFYFEGNDENAGAYRMDNMKFLWNRAHTVIQNDIVSFHSQGDSSAGSIGKIGGNCIIEGNHLYGLGTGGGGEELLDITALSSDGVRSYIQDNYLHDFGGAFVAIGWSAGYLDFRNNFLDSSVPGEAVPSSHVYCRVNDVNIYNNVFVGPVTQPFPGNTRGQITLLGSGTIASENPERVNIQHNTHVLHTDGKTAVNATNLALQMLTLSGRPDPVQCTFKNNIILMPSGKHHNNAVIEFSDATQFSPASSGMDINDNYYGLVNNVVYEITNSNLTLAQFQSTYAKDVNSVFSTVTNILQGGEGPDAYVTTSALTKTCSTLPSFAATDFYSQSRSSNPRPGAFI